MLLEELSTQQHDEKKKLSQIRVSWNGIELTENWR